MQGENVRTPILSYVLSAINVIYFFLRFSPIARCVNRFIAEIYIAIFPKISFKISQSTEIQSCQ